MTALIDTSVIVRYLVGRPPDLAERAREILDSDERLLVTPLVLAETAWVLSSVYRVPRQALVDHLIALVQKRNVEPLHVPKALVLEGLMLCRPSGRVSYTDALLWASVRTTEGARIYSFDDRFPADGVEVVQRPPA